MVYLIFLALLVLGIHTFYTTTGSRISRMISAFTKVIVVFFSILIFAVFYLFFKEVLLGS